jgi:taurine dioxygenase
VRVEKVGPSFAAEITDVDLHAISDADYTNLTTAFSDFEVIFIRDQQLTPEQHIAFAERWGQIDVNRFFTPVADHPQIAEVRKEPDQLVNIGGGWHTDHSYDAEPAMGSILVARDLPPSGGDTMFASMSAAFESLPGDLKEQVTGLNAVHSNEHIFGANAAYQQSELKEAFSGEDQVGRTIHPLVITHPFSGRKVLYVNPGFTIGIEGWSEEESQELLATLYQHALSPNHICRMSWAPGSVAMWDNRATWHYALNDYHGERRLMHRITVTGCALGR